MNNAPTKWSLLCSDNAQTVTYRLAANKTKKMIRQAIRKATGVWHSRLAKAKRII